MCILTDMPYKNSAYVRKTNRGCWLSDNMEKAMERVKDGKMSIGEASRYYDVPKSTLGRRMLDQNKVAKGSMKHLGRFKTTFDQQFEEELVQYVKDMEGRFFGITYLDLRKLAFQLAERNNLEHQFNRDKQLAGKKWVRLFMKRQPSLSLRQPEATSYARATGFNKPAVQKFFSLLTEIVDKYKLDGSRIYNCDESGMKTVQQKHSKVIAVKGKKQVGSMTSSERGKNVTVVCCTNACGHYIPPVFIFGRKRMNPVFMDYAPPSSKGFVQDNGWMTMTLFKSYLEHFVEMVKPSKERPVCLILDGHSSHNLTPAVLKHLITPNQTVSFFSHCRRTRHINCSLLMSVFLNHCRLIMIDTSQGGCAVTQGGHLQNTRSLEHSTKHLAKPQLWRQQ